MTGEEVTYGYDSLGRLTSAVTTGPEWGLNFSYDGFGNLTAETAVKGSAPNGSFLYDQSTNRLAGAGYAYDANGNMTAAPGNLTMSYDAWNRMTGGWLYGVSGSNSTYGPGNERIIETTSSGGTYIYFYGPDGKLLGKYSGVDGSRHQSLIESYVYFAGRLIWTDTGITGGKGAVVDRVGSVVSDGANRSSYYPCGESSSQNVQFATYPSRQQYTGLDYAYNRYYSSRFMRFTSPDPYMASGGPADPQSWNRYAYVKGDPVNFNDPTGLFSVNAAISAALLWGDLPYTETVTAAFEPLAYASGDGGFLPFFDGGGGGGEVYLPPADPPEISDGGGGSVGDGSPNAPANDRKTTQPCSSTPISGDATYYNLVGSKTASGQLFNPKSMNAAMFQPGFPLGSVVTVRLQRNPHKSVIVTINDTGPFERGGNGRALIPLHPDPNIIIDLTPTAFTALNGSLKAGRVPVTVMRKCP